MGKRPSSHRSNQENELHPEQAAHRSYHYLPLTTTIVADAVDCSGFAQSSLQIGSLLAIAKEQTCVGRAVRAFLWITGDVKRAAFQTCKGDVRYIELCPSYMATVEGVTRWAAREAWSICIGILRWTENTAKVASAFGARLRDLSRGNRWGRHMFFTKAQHEALMLASNTARESGLLSEFSDSASDHGAYEASIDAVDWGSRPGVRTTAVRCPIKGNHKHGDKTPSLVLWRPNSAGVGGAMCMVCTSAHGDQRTWAVRYAGDVAHMYPSRRSAHTPKTHLHPPLTNHRHNKHPIGCSSVPIGGCQSDHYATTNPTFIGARLSAYRTGGSARLARSIGNRLKGDPLSCLRWSESRSRGDSASTNAAFIEYALGSDPGCIPEEVLPTSLCSVSSMTPTGWVETHFGSAPSGWEARSQRWVLFDLDDVQGLGLCGNVVGGAISRIIRRDSECSGRLAVVQTGPVGIQVWVELREARHSPVAWHRSPNVVDWYTRLGGAILLGCHKHGASGGRVDMASCSAGRFGRRPGWRLLPDGSVFRSALVHVSNDKVPNRGPRRNNGGLEDDNG